MTDSHPHPALSLVICTLDEHEAIGALLDEVAGVFEGVRLEIIVVDDSADDRTAAVVSGRAARNPAIRLIHRQGARGLASAVIAGWDAASGDILGVMDGDGQHDPRVVRALLDQITQSKADMAVASRNLQGDFGLKGFRRTLSRSGTLLTRLMLGVQLSDPLSGCFLITRAWLDEIRPRLSGVGFKILIDAAASGRHAPTTVEAPTALRPRGGGESKLDMRVMADLAALLVEKRTKGLIPARLSLFLGVGASGVIVNLGVLLALKPLNWPFLQAQALAILAAMTWNFALNNLLTFRDKRLVGMAMVRGLGVFYLACLGGAVLAEAIGWGVEKVGGSWTLAGVAGAIGAAFWNYASTRRWTWGAKDHVPPPQPALATDEPA